MPERDAISVSSGSTLANKTGTWKYVRPDYRDRVAPCNARCPVGIDVEGYLNLLREGRIGEAQDLLLRENPMPATTGRVCDHPCELSCNRAPFDEPVAVHAVERRLGDRALHSSRPTRTAGRMRESVAVLGSGPAGLACAYHLARLGYHVTIYEGAAEPGGMLRYGIPEYRLPKDVLRQEIDRILALGIELRCGVRAGANLPWESLDRFHAVFVATGAHLSRPMGIRGEDAPGIRSGLSFLRDVAQGLRPELGKRVVVVGGGNTAMDCARVARRLGAEVVVLYRRSRDEMPAIRHEVEEAEAEGVQFVFLAAPVAAVANGDLDGLTCLKMRLGEPDQSGRRRPEPIKGSEFFLPADSVLSAVGEASELSFLPEDVLREGGLVRIGPLGASTQAPVFAGGDLVDQPRTVAHALGAGKRAAIGIDRFLRTGSLQPRPEELSPLRFGGSGNLSATRWRGDDPLRRVGPVNEVVGPERINTHQFTHASRGRDRRLTGPQPVGFGEVNQGLAPEVALSEAQRCFNCGVCNGCEVCLIFCPDAAVHRDGAGRFTVDQEHCKGCGVCAAECPRGAITMTREGL